ncbi:MAG: hypothetical protein KDB01_18300 [Planctomycetaceae bacterium]|nr:hypothetical protein [Planctomycetaceae bacterium]
MGEISSLSPESVNEVMGAKWYENFFRPVEEDFLKQQDRAMQNVDRLSVFWHASTKSQLEADLSLVQKAFDDCTADLIDISTLGARQQIAIATLKQSRVKGIFSVLCAGLEMLNIENWMLEDLHAFGVNNAFLRIAFIQLREKANAALKTLQKVEARLQQAKKRTGESIDQLKINGLLAVISPLVLPAGPIGVLAAGAIGVGQIILDDKFGVSTSDAAGFSSKATTVLGIYSTAMGDILAANKEHLKAAKVAKVGKGLALLGVAFDLNEVLEAGSQEGAVKAEFEKAAKDWEALAALVDLNDEIVDDMVKKNNLARKETKKRGLASIESARKTLASAIKSTGYDPARR